MATPTQTPTGANQQVLEQKIQKLRELYADAPKLGATALENGLPDLTRELAAATGKQESAGRVGARQGGVSELTVILPLAEGGAKRLRGLLQLLEGHFQGADKVGTVHDMRFVFLDDTKLLFATAYDGEWDAYIEDFATKIPDAMDVLFSNIEGWPGIRSSSVKDFLAGYQLSAESWYVANPDLSVVDTRRLKRVGAAVEEFLDKVGE